MALDGTTSVVLGALAAALAAAAVGVRMALRERRRRQEARFFQQGELAPGARVVVAGRFEIERLVEEGGMGLLYRARDLQRPGRPVALKLMRRERGGPAERARAAERFDREIRILASLQHPRIAAYVAHGHVPTGDAYLAMSWLDGEDLRARLKRGRLPLEDCLRVLTGAAEGLTAAHDLGVVHRDLKPANLFLRGGATADLVLLDFGLARRLESASQVTGTAALVGTPQYMAPEQASRAGEPTPATDVFALGCVFHECLTGKQAFGGAHVVSILAGVLFDNPEPVAALRASVPPAWAALLARMLSKQPAQRPADARALMEAIRQLPPAGPEAASEVEPRPAPALGAAADQVLMSVVLVAGALGFDSPAPGGGAGDARTPSGFESARTALGRLGCVLERLVDDSVLATVLPRASANDQARIAARCALALRELWPRAAMAITTGPAPLDRRPRVGDAVDRAVRLLGREGTGTGATSASIKLDSLTAGLLGGRFITEPRDGGVVLVAEDRELDDTRLLLGRPTPCVGREAELAQLEELMASVVGERVPRAALVIGAPGIGKSRLRHELGRRLQARHPDAQLLVGFGDLVNAGSPYAIVADALRRRAGIALVDDPARARALLGEQLCATVAPAHRRRVAEFLGELCGVPFSADESPPLRAARSDERLMREQIALAFADFVASRCAHHPVVLVLEDVQWSDALTVKLIEGTLRDLRGGPLLVVAFGRPETEESFPRLMIEHRAFVLTLRPLGAKASESLVHEVLGDSVPRAAVARAVELARGNALFLEELIRAIAEGRAADVPETVLAMLQARLSRLAPEARLVLRAAAVFGETAWRDGIGRVCGAWAAPADADAWLDHLVEAELLERRRHSRFPGHVEYGFRHQLISEAASALSADGDRQVGHDAAGRWLEEIGEPDAIVLARHALAGGATDRAITCLLRAAEQSLGQNDFDEALARAERGIGCGAAGRTLGALSAVKTAALFNMSRWVEAAEVSAVALELLPRGSVGWCATVEKLMQVLPNVDLVPRYHALADELLATTPADDARDAYQRALHAQLLGYAIGGAHRRGQICIAFIDRFEAALPAVDVVIRGHANLWRGYYVFLLDTEMERALDLLRQAIRDLTESQIMHRLAPAHIIQSYILLGLGEHEASEASARRAAELARNVRDTYHGGQAAWYLGLGLIERADPACWREAEACAEAICGTLNGPIHELCLPAVINGGVALARGEWGRAEELARVARAGLYAAKAAPIALISSAHLIRALVALGRPADAAAVAREDLAAIAGMEGPVCTEVPVRVAAAEALYAAGELDSARAALRDARACIELRAGKIADPALRASYLERRPENQKALALERLWSAAGSAA